LPTFPARLLLQAVEELLQQLGLTGDEPVTCPSWHYQEQPDSSSSSSSMSLHHALTVCYDIKTPKATPLLQLLLQQLTAAAGDGSSKEQQQQSLLRPSIDLQVDATGGRFPLTAAAAAGDGSKTAAANGKAAAAAVSPAAAIAAVQALLAADAAALEQYLAPRHVIDVLQEYSAAKLTPQQLLGVLRPLQPRLYSISSTPLEYSPPGSGVAATIAVVRYTSLDKERQGVCSTQVGLVLNPYVLC
jgi:sulfite reductase (NADPH) flavoprotein alpha-component